MIRDVEQLKDVLVVFQEQSGNSFIGRTVGQFRKQLASITAVKGDHTECCFMGDICTVDMLC